jgi:hypothetical protein
VFGRPIVTEIVPRGRVNHPSVLNKQRCHELSVPDVPVCLCCARSRALPDRDFVAA